MRSFQLSLSLLIVCFLTSALAAQDDQNAQIDDRLEEVQKMIDEEQSTIALLEDQLKEALNKNDTERVEKLRAEIEAAYESLEKLKELNDQLRELKDSVGDDDEADMRGAREKARSPRGRRRVPNPRIGGSEGSVDWEAERRRRERKREQQRRGNGDQGMAPGDFAPGRGGRADSGRGRGRGESSRLKNLRDAFDALMDAGELEMAEDVQDLIDREERKMDRENRSRDRGSRDRGSRDRGRGGNAPAADGPAMADGPASADGNSGRSRSSRDRSSSRDRDRSSSRDRSRSRDRDTGDEIDDLEDEIDRLRDKLRDLKERRDEEDG